MTPIWPLPKIEVSSLRHVEEKRPIALVTGKQSWESCKNDLRLPIVVQAEPHTASLAYLDSLANSIPPTVGAIYGVGGGLVCDVAKYIGWKNHLPVTVIPTALSVDGFFTALVAARQGGVVEYITTGPVERLIFDWGVIARAPKRVRGAAILELLTMVTGLLDWRYAADHNKNTSDTRYQAWAASVAAGIAKQAFQIAAGVGEGKEDALRNLMDLVALEVQLTNQLGHNRPQEGSEQYFAYAIESKITDGQAVPYADMVGPGILIAGALHKQDIQNIRRTLEYVGVRLDQLPIDLMEETLIELPRYVREHNLPYSIVHDLDLNRSQARDILRETGFIS